MQHHGFTPLELFWMLVWTELSSVHKLICTEEMEVVLGLHSARRREAAVVAAVNVLKAYVSLSNQLRHAWSAMMRVSLMTSRPRTLTPNCSPY